MAHFQNHIYSHRHIVIPLWKDGTSWPDRQHIETCYDQLAAFYMEVMTQDKGFYLKRFQSLEKSLESIEAGSGLTKQIRTHF
jgi:hypothetical protein